MILVSLVQFEVPDGIRCLWCRNFNAAALELRLHFEGFLRLDREADRNIGRTIEFLEHLVAEQTTILTLGARSRRQLDAPIAGVTGGTGDIGFLHPQSMPRGRNAFQPAQNTKFLTYDEG
jgi:hypothetical protein